MKIFTVQMELARDQPNLINVMIMINGHNLELIRHTFDWEIQLFLSCARSVTKPKMYLEILTLQPPSYAKCLFKPFQYHSYQYGVKYICTWHCIG